MEQSVKVLVIIPTFNERESLPGLIQQILQLPQEIGILVVDDHSPDGTGGVAETLAGQASNRLWVLHRPKKGGIGSAYIDGFQWGLSRDFDLFIEMDGDGSHDVAAIPLFLKEASGADLVIGSRYLYGTRVLDWPLLRLILSYSANVIARWVTGLPLTDCTTGFKCFRRHVLEQIPFKDVRSTNYDFQIEINALCHWRGYTLKEIPITFSNRVHGSSKLTGSDILRTFVVLWRLGLQRALLPLRSHRNG